MEIKTILHRLCVFCFFIVIFVILYYLNMRKLRMFHENYMSHINNFKTHDDSLIILDNFYEKVDFLKIIDFLKSKSNNIQFKNDIRLPSRKTICFKKSSYDPLYSMIYNKTLNDYINHLCGKSPIKPSFPIEYRIYPQGSSGMDWHSDSSLYHGEYYEAVLTLENQSDSKFNYKYNNQIKTIKTKPNTLILVKPNTIQHEVTPINRGYRTILKFVIVFNDNKENDNFLLSYNSCPN
jgi:hypothetical protein